MLFAKGGNFVGDSERTNGNLTRTGAPAVTTALYREIVIFHFFSPPVAVSRYKQLSKDYGDLTSQG